jgi:hypothetical protein
MFVPVMRADGEMYALCKRLESLATELALLMQLPDVAPHIA